MSVDTLISPYWYRVADLHPRVRPHVSVQMQTTRGQAWYVLFNQSTGRHHRVNAHAYELVGRMDGRCTVDQVWQLLIEQLGDEAPSQHDVIRILGQMTEAGLIQAEVLPDVRELLLADEKRLQREQRSRLNPLSFRLGLFNPSSLLERVAPLGRVMWAPWAQALWLVVVAAALWGLVVNWREAVTFGQLYFLSPGFLAAAWVIYPIMKGLHELGHALALRRYGCEVPEVGVNFFAFVPMPYVDASASNRLVNRWQRAHISVAGIWIELALAATAMLLWLVVEDGWLRQVLFVVMSLGGLSTLLFNGNPLMRLDGYYALCDGLDLPNLAVRSGRAHARWWRRAGLHLLKLKPDEDDTGAMATDALERWALLLHAPASWLYRLGVTWLIVSWAADKASWLGVAVMAWALWSLCLSPSTNWLKSLTSRHDFSKARGRAVVVTLAGAGLITVLGGVVPLPSSLVAQGIVWLPDDAQVRASSDGEVDGLLVRPDQRVAQGEALLTLASPSMESERVVLLTQIERSESEYHAALGQDALKMQNAQESLNRDRAALKALEAELSKHVLRAGMAGRFVLSRGEDLDGHQVNRGQLLAYVLSDGASMVRAVVPQRDIEAVRHRMKSVTVMLDEQPGVQWAAHWLREVPAAADRLPHPSMGDRSGGRVPTDPEDKEGLRPQEPSYVIDVALTGTLPRTGGLARVRIDLEPQTLWATLSQRARQLLLRHFSDLKG
jgi:putative peptide zinc metalloprotease protein